MEAAITERDIRRKETISERDKLMEETITKMDSSKKGVKQKTM